MNHSELSFIREQFDDAWQGDPWFGRSATALLEGISEAEAYARPGGQHSIAQLVWHMVNWREFVLSRIQTKDVRDLHYFEENDWRPARSGTPYNWSEGLKQLAATQEQLNQVLSGHTDALLDRYVSERSYTFRKMLNGILQHDIYHLGQIAYLVKLLRSGVYADGGVTAF